ncbi:MFS transporter [Actinomadura vinacea]|uniref:MFS transporter n=1 Tax=Actinomadura vinacea TaxID=115336 RepID=A0ABP5XP39_9ACTN
MTAGALRGLVPVLPRGAWVVLSANGLSAIGSGMTLPFLAVYLHTVRGIDLRFAGLAVATGPAGSLVGNPLAGRLADRHGPRNALVIGLVVAAAGTAAIVGIGSAWQAFAACAVAGAGLGMIWPSEDTLLTRTVPAAARDSMFGVQNCVSNTGFAAGGLLAALVADVARPASFTLLYLFDAVTFLVAIGLLLRVRERRAPAAERRPGGYGQVLRDRAFRRLWLLGAVLIGAGVGQYAVTFPAFATGTGGISTRALALAFAANTLTVALLQLPALRILSRHGRTTALRALSLAWAAAWVVTWLSGQVGGSLAVAGFVLAMILLGVGETLLAPTLPAMANDMAPEHLRGRYNGAFTLAFTCGFLVGPTLGGLALDAGQVLSYFSVLVAACAVAAWLAGRLVREPSRTPSEAPA